MVFTELLLKNPKISIILISVVLTFIMTLITKYTTDQDRMRELKEIQKACQIKMKENKNNLEEYQKIQKQIMGCTIELMKHSFKPILFTFIPFILLFYWISGTFRPILGNWWIAYYILASLVSNMFFRKILKVV